jgi:hypothetical protein
MNDTPVTSSSQPAQPNVSSQAPIGGGYVDPLAQVLQIPPEDLAQPSVQQEAPQAIHSFEPEDIPPTHQGSVHKEFAPVHVAPEMRAAHESIPEIAPQVVEAGVEHSPETTQEKNLQEQITQATQDLVQSLPQTSVTAAPSVTEPTLPLTKLEAEEVMKTETVDSGRRWWATLIDKLLKETSQTKTTEPL